MKLSFSPFLPFGEESFKFPQAIDTLTRKRKKLKLASGLKRFKTLSEHKENEGPFALRNGELLESRAERSQ